MAPPTPRTLEGKVAIVTGGSRGIGEAIVADLAARGAKVAATYSSDRSGESVKKLKESLESAHNTSIIGIQCDLSEPSSAAKVVSETTKTFGPNIDILVNNAGYLQTYPIDEITPEAFDKHYHLNVRAPILMLQAVLPHLRRPGRVIMLSSVGARNASPTNSLYCSSKAAVEGLTKAYARALGGDGTTVNAVAPGPVRSEMLDKVPKEIVRKQMEGTAVQGRTGEPGEVAEIVGFLAEERSSWVSGQVINASGGFTMY